MENRNRTISNLRDILKGKVWVYLKDEETCRRFYEDAEQEGFLFGKYLPTDAGIDDIIAIHKDKTLAHVGSVGHMAFHAPSSVDGGLLRIDYAKYIAGDENFYYSETEA